MTHRVVVDAAGMTAIVYTGTEAECIEAVRHLPGTPFYDEAGKQIGTVDSARVEASTPTEDA